MSAAQLAVVVTRGTMVRCICAAQTRSACGQEPVCILPHPAGTEASGGRGRLRSSARVVTRVTQRGARPRTDARVLRAAPPATKKGYCIPCNSTAHDPEPPPPFLGQPAAVPWCFCCPTASHLRGPKVMWTGEPIDCLKKSTPLYKITEMSATRFFFCLLLAATTSLPSSTQDAAAALWHVRPVV